ncbi:MAG TPA: chemotaxis protein CheW [Cellvibrionaceae bacterium]
MSRSDQLLEDYLAGLLTDKAPVVASEHKPIEHSSLPAATTETSTVNRLAQVDEDAHRLQLQRLLHSARLQVEQIVEPESPPPISAASVSQTIAPEEPVIEDIEALQQHLQWHSNGRPLWAQQQFDVLLFKVSGLTLAVPLVALGQIQPLTEELTPLFGQADWFMGLQPTAGGKIRTVNTARFVMPERYDKAFEKSARYVVSINGLPWGLAVDTVEQPITLDPEDVKWRSSRTQRPWLAGTVKAQMCALLDIAMIGRILVDSDKNAKRA